MRTPGGQQNVGRRQALKLATAAVGGLALTTFACDVLGGAAEEAKPPARTPLWTFALLDMDGIGKGLDDALMHHDGMLYVRSKNDGLYAIDAATGRKRWRAPLAGVLPGAPAVTSGAVFVATDGGAVHAMRTADGEQMWRQAPGGRLREPSAGDVWTSGSVALVSFLPYTYDGDRDPPPSVLYALDTRDGDLLWHTEASLLEVRDGVVYVNPPDESLTALDPRTGVVRWSAPPEKSGGLCTLDAFAAGLLFGRNGNVGIGSKLVAYDPRTGDVRWTAAAAHASVPVAHGDAVYISAPGRRRRDQQQLQAFDATSGKRRWTAPAFSTTLNDSPAIAADEDCAYLSWSEDISFGEDRTTLRAYDARTGRERWRSERPDSSYAADVAPGNRLFICYLRDWYCYDTSTGKALWRVSAGEGTSGPPPLAADGLLYFANDEGVHALRL
ncbi:MULTISPECIES: PQQ-like beta-propeller repeat protein [unclassified Streptomyces]|uniref:PQQ-like beta-propeller repeat protein n=1 Tax=unclassified Streptomyces TaxID=2593676 RepID=UPI002259A0DE|nr:MULTISPECIES: PQQ-like beta-propeller repeat protein [unclassified Streptomyces]MCX5014910.1 PQQ-like beta-propeller repeat protein [Streptomyces sp. NBC_00555]MCX5613347.1 PQQ-like beta-propeller repeat protein [Streptomyces sp. NBC_00047]